MVTNDTELEKMQPDLSGGEVILNKGSRWWEEMWPEAKAEKGTRGR